MHSKIQALILTLVCGVAAINASAQLPVCPSRPQPGTFISNPLDLYSQNGLLTVDLKLQNSTDEFGFMNYCYVYMYQGQPIEAPTLRLNPGDRLVLNLTTNTHSPFDR